MMAYITGTLTWDTTVADNPGWLVHSAALVDGASCIPSPAYYGTAEDASEEELYDLIVSTLCWEGYAAVENLTLEASADSYTYTWTAEVEK